MTPPVWLACAAIGAGALDFGLLALAGPQIDADLRLGPAYPWLFSASSFTFAALLMSSGTAVARRGPATMLRAGFLAVAAGHLLTALASGASLLVLGRVLVGAGGAMLAPAALATLATAARRERGQLQFARSGGAVALGFVTGVLLGGVVTSLQGWRTALCLAAGTALVLAIPITSPSARRQVHGAVPGSRLIGLGATIAAAGIAGGRMAVTVTALVAGGCLAGAGLRRACRPGGWSRSLRRTLAWCLTGACVTASGVGGTALIARAMIELPAASGITAGLVMSAFGLGTPVAVRLSSTAARRAGPAACAASGLALQGLALLLMARIGAAPGVVLAAALALLGAAHVAANAGATQLALGGPDGGEGPRGALLATAQYFGAGVGALVVLGAAGSGLQELEAGLGAAAALAFAGAILAVRTPH